MIKRYKPNGEADKEMKLTIKTKWGNSITDTSHWRPDSSLMRAEMGIDATASAGLYDYESQDEANEAQNDFMAYLRRKDLDITEIEQVKTFIEKDLEKQMEKARKEMEQKELENLSQENTTETKQTQN